MSDLCPLRHFTGAAARGTPAQVSLVGAGPGDPELLTLKAARALAQAELVLYDNLVSPQVLALVPSKAERVYVGKRSACHAMSQQAIVELMIEHARAGRPVLRLKGGDPYVFGRGGEEAEALARAGVPFVVIPGISAAQGAAACAGIPLTHRDHAARVVWITGHLRAGGDEFDLDWPALARPRQTVVVYMGLASLPLLVQQLVAHGLAAHTPAALVERATTPQQRTIVGTLDTLAAQAEAAAVRSPALVMIGEVVGLQPLLGGAHAIAQPSSPAFR